MPKLQTMTMLPDVSSRHGRGQLSLGYSNVDTIRREFGQLLAVVAAVTGVAEEELTSEDIAGLDLEAVRTWRSDLMNASSPN